MWNGPPLQQFVGRYIRVRPLRSAKCWIALWCEAVSEQAGYLLVRELDDFGQPKRKAFALCIATPRRTIHEVQVMARAAPPMETPG